MSLSTQFSVKTSSTGQWPSCQSNTYQQNVLVKVVGKIPRLIKVWPELVWTTVPKVFSIWICRRLSSATVQENSNWLKGLGLPHDHRGVKWPVGSRSLQSSPDWEGWFFHVTIGSTCSHNSQIAVPAVFIGPKELNLPHEAKVHMIARSMWPAGFKSPWCSCNWKSWAYHMIRIVTQRDHMT